MADAAGATLRPVPFPVTNPERIPVQRYYDADFYELERQYLWPRVWQMACRLEEIPEPARWTTARASFRIVDRGGGSLRLRCQSFKPDLERDPAQGHVEVGAAVVAAFELASPGWHDLRIPLPAAPRSADDRPAADGPVTH